MADIRIGISGWTYKPWRGIFFPKKLSQKRELEFASRQVRSIEINGSFYSLQRPSSYQFWYEQTPADFLFAIKGGRYVTHIKRLKDIEIPLANFFASGVLCLKEKMGPFLWQLPPSFIFNPGKLSAFFELLPRDAQAAAAFARKHDEKVGDRYWTETDLRLPLRHALEVRHPSFQTVEAIELLRQYNIGLVVADTAGKWPFMEDVTSDFVYVRLHGGEQLYVSGYGDAALDSWAGKITKWSQGKIPTGSATHAPLAARVASGRDVFVYFDNDVKVRAPYDAMRLAYKLGQSPDPGVPPSPDAISEEPRPISADSRWRISNKKPTKSPGRSGRRKKRGGGAATASPRRGSVRKRAV